MREVADSFYRFLGIQTNSDGTSHYSGRTSFDLSEIDSKWLKVFLAIKFMRLHGALLLIFFYVFNAIFKPIQISIVLFFISSFFSPIILRPFLKNEIEREFKACDSRYGDGSFTVGDGGVPLMRSAPALLIAFPLFIVSRFLKTEEAPSYLDKNICLRGKPFRMGDDGVFSEKHPGFSDNGETFFIERSGFLSRFFLPEAPKRVSELTYVSGLEHLYNIQLIGLILVLLTLIPIVGVILTSVSNHQKAGALCMALGLLIAFLIYIPFSAFVVRTQIKLLKGDADVRGR